MPPCRRLDFAGLRDAIAFRHAGDADAARYYGAATFHALRIMPLSSPPFGDFDFAPPPLRRHSPDAQGHDAAATRSGAQASRHIADADMFHYALRRRFFLCRFRRYHGFRFCQRLFTPSPTPPPPPPFITPPHAAIPVFAVFFLHASFRRQRRRLAATRRHLTDYAAALLSSPLFVYAAAAILLSHFR